LGLPLVDPYLQSVTSDFAHGVNFAVWGSTAQTEGYVSDFPLGTQLRQFALFQQEVLAVLNSSSTVLASRNLLANLVAAEQAQPGSQPYKTLYNDLLVNNVATGDSTNSSNDPTLHRALTGNPIKAHLEALATSRINRVI
jgi:hypothetical protein